MIKPTISLNYFSALDLRIGTIQKAEAVAGSDKMLRLTVDIGEEHPVTLMTGIAAYYPPDTLINKQIIVLANLEPKKIMGEDSQGMLIAADIADRPVLLIPADSVPPGTIIK